MAFNLVRANSEYLIDSSGLGISVPFSMAMLIRPASLPGGADMIFSAQEANLKRYQSISINSSGNVRVEQEYGAGYAGVTASGTVSAGSWHWVCALWSASSMAISVDGETFNSTSHSVTAPSINEVNIGRRHWDPSSNWFFDGEVEYCAIFASAMTNAEAAEIGAGVHPLKAKSGPYYEMFDLEREVRGIYGTELIRTGTTVVPNSGKVFGRPAKIFLFPSGVQAITSDFAGTLDAATMAASGTEEFQGTVATTLDAAVMAASAIQDFQGTFASTLDAAVMAATGVQDFQGSFAAILDDSAMAASGTEDFQCTVATTVDNAAMAASGTVANPITATFADTLAAATMAASGSVSSSAVTGTFASTLDASAMAASGTVANPITATFASSLDDAVLAASGTVTTAAVTGTFATTHDAVIMASSGVVANPITGTFSDTLDNAAMAASGAVGVPAVTSDFASTLASATMAATGAEDFIGSFSSVLDNATMAATGALQITATFGSQISDSAMAASAAVSVPVTCTFTGLLSDAVLAATGTMSTQSVSGTFATTLADATAGIAGNIERRLVYNSAIGKLTKSRVINRYGDHVFH